MACFSIVLTAMLSRVSVLPFTLEKIREIAPRGARLSVEPKRKIRRIRSWNTVWRESVTAGIVKVYTRALSSGEGSEEIQSLYCNENQYCGSSICLLPNLSFVFRFSSVDHPKRQWADLLKDIDDVLNYVLSERSTGKAGR